MLRLHSQTPVAGLNATPRRINIGRTQDSRRFYCRIPQRIGPIMGLLKKLPQDRLRVIVNAVVVGLSLYANYRAGQTYL